MSGGTFPCYDCQLYTWIEQDVCIHCGESTLPPERPSPNEQVTITERELRARAVLRFPAKNDEEGKS